MKLLISSILIIMSFFIWYIYSKEIYEKELETIKKQNHFIELDISKKKIDIKSSDSKTYVKINGEKISSWSLEIDLK